MSWLHLDERFLIGDRLPEIEISDADNTGFFF